MTAQSPEAMLAVWQKHTMAEFVHKNVDDALSVMSEDTHVLLVPSMTGASGKANVRSFYAEAFLPQIPPDMMPIPISQTIGDGRIVDEAVYQFTHSLKMDWMLPGIAPTNRRVEVAVVAIVQFKDGLIAHEHLYWDQGSVLIQLGLLDRKNLPIYDASGAKRLIDVVKS